MTYSTQKQVENDGKHLDNIINSIPCPSHGRDIGDPCWNVPRSICNNRALESGADGQISEDPKHLNAPIYKKESTR